MKVPVRIFGWIKSVLLPQLTKLEKLNRLDADLCGFFQKNILHTKLCGFFKKIGIFHTTLYHSIKVCLFSFRAKNKKPPIGKSKASEPIKQTQNYLRI